MLTYSITGSYTDLYEITMAETYFLEGRMNDTAAFDYFFRKVPNKGGYVLFAGLQDVLDILSDLHFTEEDIAFLKELKFHPSFLEYLKGFRFHGNVFACQEGEVIFPNCPALRLEGNIIEAQLAETLLLNILNFQSLIATKASRIKQVAGNSILSDMGLRRSQGLGGIHATRASIIGGFSSTSNVYAARLYGLPVTGTMAHSFIGSYDNELEAFRAFAQSRPHDCVFLADTYDTLKSGVPNAIIVAREMEKAGHRAKGIRLDSGDLAYLSKAARKMFDEAGLPYMKIVASNQLDEFVIKSLTEQGALIDIYGVGTRLATGQPDAALDGVYKLSMASGKPRLKLSETIEKTTLPGIKQVYRAFDNNSQFFGADAITLDKEEMVDTIYHPFDVEKSMSLNGLLLQPLLGKVMEKGRILQERKTLTEIAAYASRQLAALPQEYKRFENPHVYKVGISKSLLHLRDEMKAHYKK
ncbi:nicotinate phosphoribosyltransferase [Flavihumibacter rivuli]|uniref:nicotinate phosphoribosyltransferase n=1 Tax=Flavihumibacter rivuli TaxID=2838156 RepID=UPI001BDDE5EB|nr:nicotinate phosphoribosyltransferase [Flavihumibacter rivuli]ULQ57384.1 nicotinate phosphoribosyltransferase [Flavihumibacter rivuli]